MKKRIVVILVAIFLVTLELTACVSSKSGIVSKAATDGDFWAFALDPALDYTLVVNEGYPYEFGGDYNKTLQKDLVPIASDYLNESSSIEKAALVAFTMLKADLKTQGMTIGLMDAYRSYDDQQEVFDYYSKLKGWADTNRVLHPGYTEHHTGLLLNVVVWYNGGEDGADYQWWTETAERQKQYDYFKLLHETMPKYGFIDRYPDGKENITGVPCEPYEIRFVGSSAIAQEIYQNGWCLEEYVNRKK